MAKPVDECVETVYAYRIVNQPPPPTKERNNMNDNDRITSAAKTYKTTLKALTAAYEAEMATSSYTEARFIAYITKADEAFRTYQADRGIIS